MRSREKQDLRLRLRRGNMLNRSGSQLGGFGADAGIGGGPTSGMSGRVTGISSANTISSISNTGGSSSNNTDDDGNSSIPGDCRQPKGNRELSRFPSADKAELPSQSSSQTSSPTFSAAVSGARAKKMEAEVKGFITDEAWYDVMAAMLEEDDDNIGTDAQGPASTSVEQSAVRVATSFDPLDITPLGPSDKKPAAPLTPATTTASMPSTPSSSGTTGWDAPEAVDQRKLAGSLTKLPAQPRGVPTTGATSTHPPPVGTAKPSSVRDSHTVTPFARSGADASGKGARIETGAGVAEARTGTVAPRNAAATRRSAPAVAGVKTAATSSTPAAATTNATKRRGFVVRTHAQGSASSGGSAPRLSGTDDSPLKLRPVRASPRVQTTAAAGRMESPPSLASPRTGPPPAAAAGRETSESLGAQPRAGASPTAKIAAGGLVRGRSRNCRPQPLSSPRPFPREPGTKEAPSTVVQGTWAATRRKDTAAASIGSGSACSIPVVLTASHSDAAEAGASAAAVLPAWHANESVDDALAFALGTTLGINRECAWRQAVTTSNRISFALERELGAARAASPPAATGMAKAVAALCGCMDQLLTFDEPATCDEEAAFVDGVVVRGELGRAMVALKKEEKERKEAEVRAILGDVRRRRSKRLLAKGRKGRKAPPKWDHFSLRQLWKSGEMLTL